jgi:hypothetical protein
MNDIVRGHAVAARDRCIAALTLSLALAAPAGAASSAGADYGRVSPSAAVRTVGDWVVRTKDNQSMPFMVIDKRRARLYVFEAGGRLQGTAPVLLGLARGDHTVPGIGDKPLKDIKDDERTTPAGRFVAERGRNLHGDDIIWVDYDAAVSMHRVRSVGPGERRLERLASPTAADNRISYGCINVPVAFFDQVIDRVVTGSRAVVYVLPDVQPLPEVFGWTAAASRGGSGSGKARSPTGSAP